LLSALFAALRTLHRLCPAPALLAFIVGGLAHVAFLVFFYAPLIGSVYRAFGLRGPP